MRKSFRLLISIMLAMCINVFSAVTIAEGAPLTGAILSEYTKGEEISAIDLFNQAKNYPFDNSCDDALLSIDLRYSSAVFEHLYSEFIDAGEDCDFECWTGEYHEHYVIKVEVDDSIVSNEYVFLFSLTTDHHLNQTFLLREEAEYHIDSAVWTSLRREDISFGAYLRPDGTLGFRHMLYGAITERSTAIENVAELIVEDDSGSSDGYRYSVDCNNSYMGKVCLYPDGTLSYDGTTFYLEGIERAMNTIEATSGNSIGNSSSNLFNGGKIAVEENVMVYDFGLYGESKLYRERTDGEGYESFALDIGSISFGSINIIDGKCYYTTTSPSLYVTDLNGNIIYSVNDANSVVSDGMFTLYTTSDGLYVLSSNGKSYMLRSGLAFENLSQDQNWVYYMNSNGLYRTNLKEGKYHQEVYGEYVNGYLVENGKILIWKGNELLLRTEVENDRLSSAEPIARSGEFGEYDYANDHTAPMSLYNGWLYYYYSVDSSMICRRNLDGSVIDEFVCYTDDYTDGIYIFDGTIYLRDHIGRVINKGELDYA